MVVVHGGPGIPQSKPWSALAPIRKEFRFHYYHQRGCGRSTLPVDRLDPAKFTESMARLDQVLGIGAQLADLERIRRILGEDKVLLIGHSYGAFLAALYAAEFPAQVESLVLIAPADLLVLPAEGGGLFSWIEQGLLEDRKKEYGAFMAEYFNFGGIFAKTESDLVALQRRFCEFYGLAYPLREGPEFREIAGQQIGGWMAFAQFFSMGWRHDYRDILKRITARTLVLHGAMDLQPEAVSRSYSDGIRQSCFEVIANAGHFPFHEAPREFCRSVEEFFDGNASPR